MNTEFNTLEEVKKAIDDGVWVYWSNLLYVAKKDKFGRHIVECKHNNSIQMIHEQKPCEFFTVKPSEYGDNEDTSKIATIKPIRL